MVFLFICLFLINKLKTNIQMEQLNNQLKVTYDQNCDLLVIKKELSNAQNHIVSLEARYFYK